MNRRKIISITAVVVLLAGLGTAGFTGTVAAQSADNCNPIFEDCEISTWDAASAFISGLSERISYTASQAVDPLDGSIDRDTSQAEADAVQTYINNNSTGFVEYYNTEVTQDLYTKNLIIRITFDMDEKTDKYIYADFASDGTLNSINVQDNLNSGDNADEYIVLEDIAADQAVSVVEDFDKKFVEQNKVVTYDWVTKNYSKYAGHVDQSFNLQ
jgi:hypothetical protein